jgi:hypothetical protein
MSDTDLSRRLEKLENVVEPLPRLEAKQHAHAQTLQIHAGQLDGILRPKDSISGDVGKLKGSISLIEHRLTNIDGTVNELKESVAELIRSTDLARADTAGQWQLRAAMATALTSAAAAVAVSAMQHL